MTETSLSPATARGALQAANAGHRLLCECSATPVAEALARLSAAAPVTPLLPMLEGLIPWLNRNLPIDKTKPLTLEDVAYITVTAAELAAVPGEAIPDPWCRTSRKHYQGLTFWLSAYDLPPLTQHADLRRRIVWKPTGNTKAIFKWPKEKAAS